MSDYDRLFELFRTGSVYEGPHVVLEPASLGGSLIGCSSCKLVHRLDVRRTTTLPLCASPFRPNFQTKIREYCLSFQDIQGAALRTEWVRDQLEYELHFDRGKICLSAHKEGQGYRLRLVKWIRVETFFDWFNGQESVVGRPPLPYMFPESTNERGRGEVCVNFASQEKILPNGKVATQDAGDLFEEARVESLVEECEPEAAPSGEPWNARERTSEGTQTWYIYPFRRLQEVWDLVPRLQQYEFYLSQLPAVDVVKFEAYDRFRWSPVHYKAYGESEEASSSLELAIESDNESESETGNDSDTCGGERKRTRA